MVLRGTPWNDMAFMEEFHGALMDIPWNFEVPWNSMDFHGGISHGTPSKIRCDACGVSKSTMKAPESFFLEDKNCRYQMKLENIIKFIYR